MKRFRVTAAVLICVSLLSLAACGGEGAPSTAGSAPASSAAASSSAAAAGSASPAAAGAAGDPKDRSLCEATNRAGEGTKDAFVAAMKSGGDPSPAVLKKILTDFTKQLTTAAAGNDSKVAAAVRQLGAEAAKAAAAPNPAEAAGKPEFAKAGTDLAAACEAVGVKVNF